MATRPTDRRSATEKNDAVTLNTLVSTRLDRLPPPAGAPCEGPEPGPLGPPAPPRLADPDSSETDDFSGAGGCPATVTTMMRSPCAAEATLARSSSVGPLARV